MNTNIVRKIRGKNLLILFFAILILMLNMFLPIVSTKTDESDQNQYLSFESMKKSDNDILKSLSSDLNRVNILLWIIIIIGFFSFLGLILKLSRKTKKISNFFIMSGCATSIVSIISLLLSLFFLIKTNRTENVYPVLIYINLFLLLVLFIITVLFTIITIKFLISDYKSDRESKKDELKSEISKKEQKEEAQENKGATAKKHIKFKLDDWDNKRIRTIEFAENSKAEVKDDEKTYSQEDKENYDKKEISEADYKNEYDKNEKQNEEIKFDKDPFLDDHKKVKEIESEQETENLEVPNSFEKVLDSAIARKKSNTKQKPSSTFAYNKEKEAISDSKNEHNKGIPKKMDTNKKVISEKFNVKCPQCSFIFEAKKQSEGVTKIKCPKCGKEGVVK